MAIGALVTQRRANKRRPGVVRAVLLARSTAHTSTLWEESGYRESSVERHYCGRCAALYDGMHGPDDPVHAQL
jgi:hypothetical protein